MTYERFTTAINEYFQSGLAIFSSTQTYVQLAVLIAIYGIAFAAARKIRQGIGITHQQPADSAHPVRKFAYRIGGILYPLIAILLLQISRKAGETLEYSPWLIQTALSIAVLLFFSSLIRAFVTHGLAASLFRWIGLPILFLHLIGFLPSLIAALEDISINVGNVSISAYGVIRVLIFGGFLFWFGRSSSNFGNAVIRQQASLDIPTKEVFSKLFEVTLFCVMTLLLLNVMGINLTTLAVLEEQ